MAAILAQNKLNIISGISGSGGNGTATQVSTTTVLAYEVTLTARTAGVVVGDSGILWASLNGLSIATSGSITLTAFSAESLGFRGTRRGEMFVDLSEIYWDDSAGTATVSWFGFGPGAE